ncbi:MAG TPA: hypothetical protein VGP08_22220 [Pyrinomonadaceae bacterium]|jgi:hypothetical protein|nr:hypothetical protein [Pyrinomonadaceae bacterium]
MATDRSDKVYDYWREASEKFDYFITGVTGALTAYIGQNIQPHKIGLHPESIGVLALIMLITSMIAGFKRIETNVSIFRIMQRRLYSEEARGSLLSASQGKPLINEATGQVLSPSQVLAQAQHHELQAETARSNLDALTAKSGRYYKWRNWLLILGFVLLIVARIAPAYVR